MSSRAFAAYLGALVSLGSPVPLSGEPSPPPTSAGHSLRKGVTKAARNRAAAEGVRADVGPRAADAASSNEAIALAGPGGASAAAAVEPAQVDAANAADAVRGAAEDEATRGALDREGPLVTSGTLFNVHSREAIALDADSPGEGRFARFMPDRTSGEVRGFDARLLGVVRRVAERHPGARIELVSGYRSPKFNEHLRKKGHRVASHSEHSRGHALDFRIEGLTPAELVAEVRALGWPGGIGRYDGAGDRFVHVDVGRGRFWMGH